MPELLPHLRSDENAVTGAHYPIVSVYYDNAERDCYWENLNGAKSRRKLRVRLYGSQCGTTPPTCFAEVKHKVEGRNVKRRVRLGIEEALAVAAGAHTPAELTPGELRTVEEIHTLVHQRRLAPCVCLRYDRHAYAAIDPGDDLRITFDTGIAYRFERLDARARRSRVRGLSAPGRLVGHGGEGHGRGPVLAHAAARRDRLRHARPQQILPHHGGGRPRPARPLPPRGARRLNPR